MYASKITENLGFHAMWGHSPSFDLQALYRRHGSGAAGETRDMTGEKREREDAKGGEEEPLNVLLLLPADIRHVLHTLSRRRRHPKRPIHFYIVEEHVEVLARHLLLLSVAFDWEIPIRQRANLFLEIFGNCLVQERTSKYISELALQLEDLVTEGTGPLESVIDLSLLKYKERDELVDVFRSWNHRVIYEVEKFRDTRLRRMYADRYDFRRNLIDWDYTMLLSKVEEMKIIHSKQYTNWRQSGIGFEFGDQTYTVANRSMGSFFEGRERGLSKKRRGFWLDIISGPFVGLGVDAEKPNKLAEDLFMVVNKGTGTEQQRHNAVEIAVYNVLSFLFEIETGMVYKMKQEHEIYSGLGEEAKTGDDQEEKEVNGETPRKEKNEQEQDGSGEREKRQEERAPEEAQQQAEESELQGDSGEEEMLKRAKTILSSLDGIKVFLVSGPVEGLVGKKRFSSLSSLSFISSEGAKWLQSAEPNKSINKLLRPDALVAVESARYVVPLKSEEKEKYREKVREMAEALGWERRGDDKEELKPPGCLLFRANPAAVAS